jgi:hypothetical protein
VGGGRERGLCRKLIIRIYNTNNLQEFINTKSQPAKQNQKLGRAMVVAVTSLKGLFSHARHKNKNGTEFFARSSFHHLSTNRSKIGRE